MLKLQEMATDQQATWKAFEGELAQGKGSVAESTELNATLTESDKFLDASRAKAVT